MGRRKRIAAALCLLLAVSFGCRQMAEAPVPTEAPMEAAAPEVTPAPQATGTPRQVQIEVEPCIKGESTSDWSRLVLALQKEGLLLDGPAPEPDPEIASQAGPLQRSTGGRMWALVSGKSILEISAEKIALMLSITKSVYLITARMPRFKSRQAKNHTRVFFLIPALYALRASLSISFLCAS